MSGWVLAVVIAVGTHLTYLELDIKPMNPKETPRAACERGGKLLLKKHMIMSYHCFPPKFIVDKS